MNTGADIAVARRRLEVIAGPNGGPWAILGARSEPKECQIAWCGQCCELEALVSAGRLLPATAIFCAELTARWGMLVLCTPEFLADARQKGSYPETAGAPLGFSVELLS